MSYFCQGRPGDVLGIRFARLPRMVIFDYVAFELGVDTTCVWLSRSLFRGVRSLLFTTAAPPSIPSWIRLPSGSRSGPAVRPDTECSIATVSPTRGRLNQINARLPGPSLRETSDWPRVARASVSRWKKKPIPPSFVFVPTLKCFLFQGVPGEPLIVAPNLMAGYCCGALPQPKAAIACRQICRPLWIICRWRRGLFAGCHSGGDDVETARVVPLRIEAPYCPTICGRCTSRNGHRSNKGAGQETLPQRAPEGSDSPARRYASSAALRNRDAVRRNSATFISRR